MPDNSANQRLPRLSSFGGIERGFNNSIIPKVRAMVFAAGLGTRLRPLTDDRPKALVPVGGMPLLEIALRRLKWFGIEEVIVNVHHFADQIEAFLREKENFGMRVAVSDERERLLDTGGGLKRAAWFFENDPFLVVNVDILTDLDLNTLAAAHRRSGALATLAVQRRPTSRCLLLDDDYRLAGWRNRATGAERRCRAAGPVHEFAFSGIQALSPDIFGYMPADKAVFSIIDVYLEAGARAPVRGYPHDDTFWLDVGRPEALAEAERVVGRLDLG